MADNTTINLMSGGDVVATDDVAGVKYQRVKLTLGTDGANDGDVASANPLPVIGPLTDAELRATALPVSGPLTDAELRATALPVSGTFWQATQPISGTVAISGAVAVTGTFWQATQPVSGPLTDTQLRATAVPVSDGGGSLTVDGTVSANATPEKLKIWDNGAGIIYVCTNTDLDAALTDATWRIKKVDGSSDNLAVSWCDGNVNYDNVATSLAVVAALTYA